MAALGLPAGAALPLRPAALDGPRARADLVTDLVTDLVSLGGDAIAFSRWDAALTAIAALPPAQARLRAAGLAALAEARGLGRPFVRPDELARLRGICGPATR